MHFNYILNTSPLCIALFLAGSYQFSRACVCVYVCAGVCVVVLIVAPCSNSSYVR